MATQGWNRLLTDIPRYGKGDPLRIMAYSDMMPSPWMAVKNVIPALVFTGISSGRNQEKKGWGIEKPCCAGSTGLGFGPDRCIKFGKAED